MRILIVGLLLVSTGWLSGCSRVPARAEPPEIPDDAGAQAVLKFDKNGDGALEGQELEQIPAIKLGLTRFDTNQDKKVDAEEISCRVLDWKESRIGLWRGSVIVMLDGRPLDGAEVRLVPEEFLGTAIQPASGITDREGRARLKISDEPRQAGMQLGLYKIHISKKSSGEEAIPAKYNAQSTLGVEIAPSAMEDNWTIKLTRK